MMYYKVNVSQKIKNKKNYFHIFFENKLFWIKMVFTILYIYINLLKKYILFLQENNEGIFCKVEVKKPQTTRNFLI